MKIRCGACCVEGWLAWLLDVESAESLIVGGQAGLLVSLMRSFPCNASFVLLPKLLHGCVLIEAKLTSAPGK